MEEQLTDKTVVSLRGHDCGRLYAVVKVLNKEFVLCCDGKYRKLDNPKLKRVKHLRVCGQLTREDFKSDDTLKRALKNI